MLAAIVVLWLFHIQLALGQKYCTDDGTTFCVYGRASPDNNNIVFTVHSSSTGWVALGVGGQEMEGTDMYIAWKNSTGGVTLSHRIGRPASSPQIASTDFTLMSLQVLPTDSRSTKIAFSFIRPLASSSLSAKSIASSGSGDYMFAYGKNAPSSLNDNQASFSKHDNYGTFRADLTLNPVKNNAPQAPVKADEFDDSGTTGKISTPPILNNMDKKRVDLIHGIVMIIAWAVSPYIGIFIARFLKDALGVWWFRLHVLFMLVITGLCTIAGIVLEYLYSSGPHFMDNPHKMMGLAVGIAMIIQILLGIVSDRLFSMDRTRIPWWDKLHWYLGRLVFLAGLINCFLGLRLYRVNNLILGLFIGWVVLGCLVLLFGQYKYGSVHHGKLQTLDGRSTSKKSLLSSVRKNSSASSAYSSSSFLPGNTGNTPWMHSMAPTKTDSYASNDDLKFIGHRNPNVTTHLPVFSSSSQVSVQGDALPHPRSQYHHQEDDYSERHYPVIPNRKMSAAAASASPTSAYHNYYY